MEFVFYIVFGVGDGGLVNYEGGVIVGFYLYYVGDSYWNWEIVNENKFILSIRRKIINNDER